MPITSLAYEPSLRRSVRRAPRDFEKLEVAVELYENGRSLESIHQVLEHLFPEHEAADLAKAPFVFTQGSSKVTVSVEGDHLLVTVPVVRLPSGGSAIAAMRYVLTMIAGSGQLHQPELRGEEIHIRFKDELARIHPAKLIEVLRNIPLEADRSDDWIIGQFSAEPLERAQVDDLTDEEAARAEAFWQRHWDDVDELIVECQRKRSVFFLNELTSYALTRVSHTLPLTGYIGLRLSEAGSTFNDNNVDPSKREAALVKCAREMKAISGDELRKSLGHATYALDPRAEGTPGVLGEHLDAERDYGQMIERLRTGGKSLDAALALIGTYTFLVARFSWPAVVEASLVDGLTQSSGKPWREVVTLLLDHSKELISNFVSDDEDDEDDDDEDEAGEGTEGDTE
ncbi:MAG: hypothetical protein KIT72_17665 [Polyangiaceae bacterium]|nr:hypothetical protein [Polyangiaceae bacterium]MCW5792243.1 hypothetical protein [Polyangiaceae bacterium]